MLKGQKEKLSQRDRQKTAIEVGGLYHTWFVDGIRDEVLPQLCIVLLFGKFYGFVHIIQLLHNHLQSPSAVPHPAWVQRDIHCFLIVLKSGKTKA